MSDEEDEYGDQNGYNDEYEEDDGDRRRRSELDDYCGDDDDNDFIGGEEEQEEGPGTTNPSEMLEERILMLEQWMDEAADAGEDEDPALYEKHQEYLGMYEELEIIAKKLRKTDKLLSKQPSATKKKLEKKRNQYLREVEDIVSYVVGDIFFLDGEEEEHFVSQLVVTTNPLLGQPLESIIERPGMEDSQRFTLENLPGFFASSVARLGSSMGSLGGSRGSFTKPDSFKKPSSTGQLGVKSKRASKGSKPRSFRKAKTDLIDDMIEEADQEDDPVFLSPVPKPNDEQNNESEVSLDFREAILSPPIVQQPGGGTGGGGGSGGGGGGTSSSHKTNNNHHNKSSSSSSKKASSSKSKSHQQQSSSSTSPTKSSTSLNHDSSNNSNNLDSLAEIKTLQKKLRKVEGLINKPGTSSKDMKKYEKKRREYMHSIEKLEYEVNSSIGSNLAAETEKEEADRRRRGQKVLKRKQDADRKRQELIQQAEEEGRRRQKEEKEALKRQKEEERRRKEQERQRKVEDEIRALGRDMLPDEDSPNRQQRNKGSGGGPPGTKEDYELLKKKLEKAQKLVNNAITLKEAKKFEKKCKEYIAKLEEYDDWNWEVSELEKLNKKDQQRQREYEERKRIQKEQEEEEERLEEERRREDERWLSESMRSEQMMLEENDNNNAGDGDYYDDDEEAAAAEAAAEIDEQAAADLEEEAQILQEDHRLVEKKLKKVDKLMKELVLRDGSSAIESKEYHKYEKKKKQYLRELGVMETSFRSVGTTGDSIDSGNLLGDYNDGEDEEDVYAEEEHFRQQQLEEEEEEWKRRQEAEEQLAAAAAANDYTPEEIEAINLLNKKLKKVEKMMSDAMKKGDSGSKEFSKLQKKKKQYLEELDALQ